MHPGPGSRVPEKKYPSVDGIRPARHAKTDPGRPDPLRPKVCSIAASGRSSVVSGQAVVVCGCADCPGSSLALGGERFLNPPPRVTAASAFLAARAQTAHGMRSIPRRHASYTHPAPLTTPAVATAPTATRAAHHRPPPLLAARAARAARAPAAETAGARGAAEKAEGGTAQQAPW